MFSNERKRHIKRRNKDEDRLPERMVELTAGGCSFHKEKPMDAKNA